MDCAALRRERRRSVTLVAGRISARAGEGGSWHGSVVAAADVASDDGRMVVKEGKLQKVTSRGPSPRYVALFNDHLIYGKVGSNVMWHINIAPEVTVANLACKMSIAATARHFLGLAPSQHSGAGAPPDPPASAAAAAAAGEWELRHQIALDVCFVVEGAPLLAPNEFLVCGPSKVRFNQPEEEQGGAI